MEAAEEAEALAEEAAAMVEEMEAAAEEAAAMAEEMAVAQEEANEELKSSQAASVVAQAQASAASLGGWWRGGCGDVGDSCCE